MYRAPLPPPHIRGEGAYSFGRTRKLTAEQPEASTHLCCFLCLTCSQDFALSPVISPAWATTPLRYPMSFSLTGLLPTSSLCANPHTLEGLGSCCSVCPHLPWCHHCLPFTYFCSSSPSDYLSCASFLVF